MGERDGNCAGRVTECCQPLQVGLDGTIARQAMINKLMARGVYTHPTIVDNVAAALTQCPEPPPTKVSFPFPLLVCSSPCCDHTLCSLVLQDHVWRRLPLGRHVISFKRCVSFPLANTFSSTCRCLFLAKTYFFYFLNSFIFLSSSSSSSSCRWDSSWSV